MNIQRITFENRGQAFTWWEVDMETGRILGCGPGEAFVWATGRCTVVPSTVQIGARPTFHGPATEPEGRSLKWEIVDVAPAETGGWPQ